MGQEKYNLKWNEFEKSFCQSVRNIRLDADFHDVTLSVGSKQIKAHKLVLSSCSSFFKNILKENPHQHPLLYMRNVSFNELQAIVDFMYFGEVNIDQENLSCFLAVTEELQIHGLSGNINQETKKEGSRKRDKPSSDSFQSSPMKKMRSPSRRLSSPPPPPPPPPSSSTSSSSTRKPFLSSLNQQDVDTGIIHVEDLKQEVILEPDSIATDPGSMLETHNSDLLLAHQEYQVADESDIYGEDGYDYDMDMDGSNQDVSSLVLARTDPFRFECKICGSQFADRSNARRHAKAKHLDLPTPCTLCSKLLKNERSLKMHMKQHHSDSTHFQL